MLWCMFVVVIIVGWLHVDVVPSAGRACFYAVHSVRFVDIFVCVGMVVVVVVVVVVEHRHVWRTLFDDSIGGVWAVGMW